MSCQLRQKQLLQAPLTVTYTLSIFTEFHVDALHMSVSSNRCKKIAHGRCALTAWPEARAIKAETAQVLGQWLFNDVICRLGCVRKIISNNVLQYTAALDWIDKKYSITGIQIFPSKQEDGERSLGY